ncbi:hypothetical protein BJ742DRAFT_4449 [Cladochytrium replicatum]|nr:hypothetical protein BJ742DRAFT_4449 [Cladochytrium replicatum]
MESFTSGSPPQMPGSPIQVSPPPKRDLFSMSTSQKDLLTLDSEPMKPSSSASEIVFGGFVSSPSKAAAVQPPLDLRHFAPSLLDNKPLPTKPDEFAYFSGFVSAPPVQPATVPTMINSMTTTRSSMPVMNAGTFPANPTEKTILPCVSMNPIVPSQLGGFKPLNASSVDGLPSFGTQTPNPLGATSITPAADDPYAALRGFDSSVAKHSSLFDLGSYQPPKSKRWKFEQNI